jgi:hypothetical protein
MMVLVFIPIVGPILSALIGGTLVFWAGLLNAIPIIGPLLSAMLVAIAF